MARTGTDHYATPVEAGGISYAVIIPINEPVSQRDRLAKFAKAAVEEELQYEADQDARIADPHVRQILQHDFCKRHLRRINGQLPFIVELVKGCSVATAARVEVELADLHRYVGRILASIEARKGRDYSAPMTGLSDLQLGFDGGYSGGKGTEQGLPPGKFTEPSKGGEK